jgi:phospholipase C
VNGLTDALLFNNPNLLNTTGNGAGAMNPFRLDRSQAATADQDHDYTPEQEAFHGGLMDSFPEYTGTPGPPPTGSTTKGLVMGYYDGNTVTALWNYAQHYAMNDNSYDTNFGPSTPGAINLISGQTNGVTDRIECGGDVVEDGGGGYTWSAMPTRLAMYAPPRPAQLCSSPATNIGDLLNAQGITWGWFRAASISASKQQRNHRLQAQQHLGHHRVNQEGLHPAPRAIPVLHADRQSEARFGPLR